MNQIRKILRRKQVLARYSISPATLYRKIQSGDFPAPVQIGDRAVGWFDDELDAHDQKLKADRDARVAERAA